MKKLLWLIILSLLSSISLHAEGFGIGTLVKTPFGYQQIQNLKVGDVICSYNEQDQIIEQSIIAIQIKVACEHCCVTVDEQKIITSPEQKFYLAESAQWIKARDLCQPVSVEYIRSVKFLYCISLPEYHEYCVTPLDIRVHNIAPLIGIGCTWVFSAAGIEFVGASISFGIAAIAAIFGIKVAYDGTVKCDVASVNKETLSCGQQNSVVSADVVCGTGQILEQNIPQMSCGQQPEALLPSYRCGQGIEDFPLCLKTEQDRDKKREEWRPLTNKEARQKAKELGYIEAIPPFNSQENPAFRNGNDWITADQSGHKGGIWKRYTKEKREGTYNEDLTEIIGD